MRDYIFLSMLVLCSISDGFCQQSWVKRLSAGSFTSTHGNKVLKMHDGNLTTIKSYYEFNQGALKDKGFVLVNFNDAGDTNWVKYYRDTTVMYSSLFFVDSKVTQDSGIVILGVQHDSSGHYSSLLYKLDANGNLIWSNRINNSNNILYATSLYVTENHDILITGWLNYLTSELFVGRFNSAGNLLWNKIYQTPGGLIGSTGLAELNTDIIVPFRLEENTTGFQCDFGLLKIDLNGNIISCNAVKDSLQIRPYDRLNIYPIDDGGFIIAGKKMDSLSCVDGFCIVKYNNIGTQLWAKHFSIPTSFGTGLNFSGAEVLEDGTILVTLNYATSQDFYKWHVVLLKVSKSGFVMWTKKYALTGATDYSAVQTDDSGIILSIMYNDSGYVPMNGNFLIKSDSIGNSCLVANPVAIIKANYSTYDSVMTAGVISQPWFISTNVVSNFNSILSDDIICLQTNIGEIEHQNENSVSIYPNPTNSKLTLVNCNFSDLSILNVLGEVVLMINVPNFENEVKEIDVSMLVSGIYFIKSGSEMKKFIKQ